MLSIPSEDVGSGVADTGCCRTVMGEAAWQLFRAELEKKGGSWLRVERKQSFKGVGVRTMSEYEVWVTIVDLDTSDKESFVYP